jgi:uncharacterized protein YjlB
MADPFKKMIQPAEIIIRNLDDDGVFPNNGRLPLIVYQSILALPEHAPQRVVIALFEKNGWSGSWVNGIFRFHHYHSQAHEVLGVVDGRAQVQLGGEKGEIFTIKRGDVVVLPAGTAHKNLENDDDFQVVGAYPQGQKWDMCHGKPGERPAADDHIRAVGLPHKDPVHGLKGSLLDLWN